MQAANASKAVRTKAKTLRVSVMNRWCAWVEGVHAVYQVYFDDLRCTCPAGVAGLRCSHVLAAIRERAVTRRRPHVAFCRNLTHADSFARAQAGRRCRAEVYTVGRFVWVEYTDPERSVVVTPQLSFEQLQAAADSLY